MTDESNLQAMAVKSVQGRGFHNPESLPIHAHNPLLSAQRMRLEEEWGEFNRALRHNDTKSMAEELADVQIVLYQIAHILEINLASVTMHKLNADEKRGYLHGGVDDGPASLNEVANEHIIDLPDVSMNDWEWWAEENPVQYPTKSEGLTLADHTDGMVE